MLDTVIATVPSEVAALLDRTLSYELLKTIVVGDSAYYFVMQPGSQAPDKEAVEEGGFLLVRRTVGLEPKVMMVDGSLVAPGADPLPPEVVSEIELLFGDLPFDTEEEPVSGAEDMERSLVAPSAAATAATAAVDRLRRLLFQEAHEQSGRLRSNNAPGTLGGRLACAWAVNKVSRLRFGRDIGGGLAVLRMREVLAASHIRVPVAKAEEGAIILSCTQGSTHGHVGIVGGKGPRGQGSRRIYSNSSSRALFMQNYTFDSWDAYFHDRKGLPVECFYLDPRHFKVGSTPSYPGAPLRVGSKGEDVRAVQSRLKALGAKIAVDGDFGSATRQTVIALQKKAGLPADGVVGPKTWAALWK